MVSQLLSYWLTPTRWLPSLAVLLAMLLTFPALAQEKNLPEPFGFKTGMTKEQVISLVGKAAVEENGSTPQGTLKLRLKNAPRPNSHFETYTLLFSPTAGLLRVAAVGRTIETNREGEQLKAEFHEICDTLIQKYGPGKVGDFYKGDDDAVEARPEFWMLALSEKERELLWVSGDDQPAGITLETHALSTHAGLLLLFYEFPGWGAYVDSVKANNSKVF